MTLLLQAALAGAEATVNRVLRLDGVALKRLGREDLIGPGEEQLIPAWQPVGATAKPREKGPKCKSFLTQQAGQGRRVVPPVGKPPGAKPAGAGGKPSGMKPRQTNLKGR